MDRLSLKESLFLVKDCNATGFKEHLKITFTDRLLTSSSIKIKYILSC